eukprot:5718796-Pyramimonas_sp.AAC.1
MTSSTPPALLPGLAEARERPAAARSPAPCPTGPRPRTHPWQKPPEPFAVRRHRLILDQLQREHFLESFAQPVVSSQIWKPVVQSL